MTSKSSQKVGKISKKHPKPSQNDQRSVLSEKTALAAVTPQKAPPGLKIALVCDWLTTPGGAEKVLLELHQMYPDAPIYTSQYSKKGINWFDDADVRTGWLQIFPKSFRKILGPLRQLYFAHLDLTDYDLVISVTGAEAKSVRTRSDSPAKTSKTTHLCYCHVPTQYYWQMYDKYVENPGFGILNPLVRLAFKLLVKPLRQADYRAAQSPDQFITISNYARRQIEQYYHRDAIVIAPPVDISKFTRNTQAFPPSNHEKSTKNSDFSTAFPLNTSEKSTANGELSTEPSDLSTEIQEFSTSSPQQIHNKPQIFPPKLKSSPQLIHKQTLVYPQKRTSYPQVIHKLSTEDKNLSTTFPQQNSKFSTETTDFSTKNTKSAQYFIIACRQVTWKRVDLAISACKSAHLPLKVVGSGPEHNNLVKLAANDPNIEFIPWLETRELAQLLQNATAYLFPSLEPFGIAAVEALAAGCPVIAYREGGSQDYIHEGKNGLFFDQQTPDSLAKSLHEFYSYTLDPVIVAQTAVPYSSTHFREQIETLIATTLKSAKSAPLPQSAKPTPSPKSRKATDSPKSPQDTKPPAPVKNTKNATFSHALNSKQSRKEPHQ